MFLHAVPFIPGSYLYFIAQYPRAGIESPSPGTRGRLLKKMTIVRQQRQRVMSSSKVHIDDLIVRSIEKYG